MPWEGPHAPRRIETERFVLRCYETADAPLLKDAIDTSVEHLRPFSVWLSDEPPSLDDQVGVIERFREAFESSEAFVYGIFDPGERTLLGGTGLHARVGPGGLEIGYFVRASATRRGIATESTAVLTRIGFEVCGADRMEIRIDPNNTRSFGIPQKLGFPVEATLRRRLPARAGETLRDVVIHTLFREDYDPSIAPPLRAYDALGRQLL
jgi:RimJ/RimL family protein N-acetyltransferase